MKTENIGNDTVKATELGLKNIDRVLDFLVAATTTTGEDFTLLQEVYRAIMTHRSNWFNAVAKDIGGVVEHRTLGGRGTASFVRVPKKQQKEAVDFLIANAFTTPIKLLQPAIVEPVQVHGRCRRRYRSTGRSDASLLSADRIRRLIDGEIMTPTEAYAAMDLVGDVQNGIWSELAAAGSPKIDPLRRALQRAYLDHIKNQVSPPEGRTGPTLPFPFDLGSLTGGNSDYREVARASVTELQKKIATAIPETKDAMTKADLIDCAKEIEAMLAGPKK